MLLLIGAACGGGDPPTEGPTPGDLVGRLTTHHTQDGAVLLRITGPITQVSAHGSYRVAFSTSGNTTRMVVSGNLVGGDLFTLSVPDTRQLSSYSVEIEQVAERETYALRSPGNYTVSLRVK
jgi:hypothetical protein